MNDLLDTSVRWRDLQTSIANREGSPAEAYSCLVPRLVIWAHPRAMERCQRFGTLLATECVIEIAQCTWVLDLYAFTRY